MFSNGLTRNRIFNCPELLFLKGMTAALAPFSYIVVKYLVSSLVNATRSKLGFFKSENVFYASKSTNLE